MIIDTSTGMFALMGSAQDTALIRSSASPIANTTTTASLVHSTYSAQSQFCTRRKMQG